MVNENKFRQDLLYRINTVEIFLPPLRERTGDIPLLVDHFLKIYSKKYKKNIKAVYVSSNLVLINTRYSEEENIYI